MNTLGSYSSMMYHTVEQFLYSQFRPITTAHDQGRTTMYTHTKRHLKSGRARAALAISLAAVLMVGVNACSASPDEASPEGSSELETLIISTPLTSLAMGLLAPVLYTDTAAKLGFKVEIVETPGDNALAITSLLRGDADVAVAATSASLDVLRQDDSLKVVAMTSTAQGQLVLRAEVVDHIKATSGVTPESPLQDRLTALEGLSIGVTAAPSATNAVAAAMVKAGGLNPGTDVIFENTPDPATAISQLDQGRIDGAQRAGGVFAAGIAAGHLVSWVTADEVPGLESAMYNQALVSTSKSSDEKWLKRVFELFSESYQNALDNEPAFLETMRTECDNYKKLTPDEMVLVWNESKGYLSHAGQVSKDAWDAAVEFQSLLSDKDYASISYSDVVLAVAK